MNLTTVEPRFTLSAFEVRTRPALRPNCDHVTRDPCHVGQSPLNSDPLSPQDRLMFSKMSPDQRVGANKD